MCSCAFRWLERIFLPTEGMDGFVWSWEIWDLKSRWCLVQKLNIAEWSLHLFWMLPGFVCVVLVHCKSSACFQCCEEECMQHRGCCTGNPSNDLGFSSKWEVPCAWKIYLLLEAGVFLHETVFQVITFLSFLVNCCLTLLYMEVCSWVLLI